MGEIDERLNGSIELIFRGRRRFAERTRNLNNADVGPVEIVVGNTASRRTSGSVWSIDIDVRPCSRARSAWARASSGSSMNWNGGRSIVIVVTLFSTANRVGAAAFTTIDDALTVVVATQRSTAGIGYLEPVRFEISRCMLGC